MRRSRCFFRYATAMAYMLLLKDLFCSRTLSFSCEVSFLRFAPSVVSSPPPAALLLAAPSLAVLLVLVLRGMKPALPLSRPAWPPYLFKEAIWIRETKLGS